MPKDALHAKSPPAATRPLSFAEALSPLWIFSKKKEEGRKKRGSHSVTGKKNTYILKTKQNQKKKKEKKPNKKVKKDLVLSPSSFHRKRPHGRRTCSVPTAHSPEHSPAPALHRCIALPRTAPLLHGTQRPQPVPSLR